MKKFLAIVLAALVLVAGQSEIYAARQVVKTKTVTKARGNKAVTKTKTVVKGKATGNAQVNVNVNAGVGHANSAFVGVSHNGFAAFNHNFHHHNNAVAFHGYHNNFAFGVGHGYGYNAFNLIQPVTFTVATPLTVKSYVPVEVINAPAVPVTETKTVTTVDPGCAVNAVALPTVTYAPQKIVQTQVISKVAIPVQTIAVRQGY